MKNLVKNCILAATLGFMVCAHADEKAIQESLAKVMPKVNPDSINKSVIDGVYEVIVGTQIFYISDDGKYIIQGSIYDVENRKDISEEKIALARVKSIEAVGPEKMIIFKPKESKYVVTVFTDIDCGYCRKLHSEIDQYLDNNITIQYLFYPRAGKGSDSYKKAVSVWCADDRNAALTTAKKNGKAAEDKTCENPVDEHMELGRKLGANGTPMLVTENGTILPGYIPADRLAKILSAEKSAQ